MDAGAIKGFTKDGAWEEYMEITDQVDPKKNTVFFGWKAVIRTEKEGIWEEFEEKYDPSTKIKKLVKNNSEHSKKIRKTESGHYSMRQARN